MHASVVSGLHVWGKVAPVLYFNWAPRHEGVLEEWRYSSIHSLTSALGGGDWSASHPGRFTLSERAPGTHWIGGWVGPRVGLDAVVKRKLGGYNIMEIWKHVTIVFFYIKCTIGLYSLLNSCTSLYKSLTFILLRFDPISIFFRQPFLVSLRFRLLLDWNVYAPPQLVMNLQALHPSLHH
jgi:hypothetical protein